VILADPILIKMFDVAWTEPVETVGQRKTRKEKQANRLSQGSSITSKSTASSSSLPPIRPPLFGIMNQKKETSQRSGSSSKQSAVRSETASEASKCISTYATALDSPNKESSAAKKITSRILSNGCLDDDQQSNTDTDVSSPSEGMSFLALDFGWAEEVRISIFRMEWEVIRDN
jgi:hypothetical protein